MEASLPSVVHVPMAQGGQGSTLLAVAERLTEAHIRAGGRASIALGPNLTTSSAPVLPVRYGSVRFARRELRRDFAYGALGMTRPHFGHVYDPVIEALDADPPDVVLLYEGHYAAASLPQWQSLRRRGAEVCLYVHNPLSRSYRRTELRRLCRSTDRVIFVSEHLRARTEARLGSARGLALEVVHNGVDEVFRAPSPRNRPPDGDFVVTFVGRVSPNKGPHLAVQAADWARQRTGLPIRVRVIGDGWYGQVTRTPYESWLREQCALIETPVEFLPFMDRHAVAAALATSSAVCLPSEDESFGLAMLEAMASAVPVVCSDIPALREVGGAAVLATPRDDLHGLAEALATLAQDPGEWERRSRAVWDRAQSYSWAHTATRLADVQRHR